MVATNAFRKLLASFTALAILCLSTSVALAATPDISGELTVTGKVTVNGQEAVSNSTIVSGSSIVTGANSTAVVSLGKVGRIELMPNSNVTLNFSDNSIVAVLSSGKAQISSAAGTSSTVTTKDTTVLSDSTQADNYIVEVECSHTHVDTLSGVVTMREGTSDRQVAAGSSASAGNLAQTGCQPCLRPNSAPPIPIGGWPWLLLIAGGVAAAALLLGGDDNETGGTVVVVSPTR